MTNLGFFHFTKAEGINTVATKVGDRYVLEEMRANGHIIGGEQSGHIIFSQHASTGDGQLSAVKLLHIMKESEQTLSSLSSVMERFPQVLVNVKADSEAKARYAQDQEIADLIEQVGNDLGDNGRILVRPSGTEPIVRVMIEGKNLEEIQQLADSVAKAIEERIH